MGAAGDTTSMLVIGGAPNTCEFWNGSSWTEIADLATPREGQRGCGTAVSAVVFGGAPNVSSTEEFTASEANKTITLS